jgi:hypothetical protein
LIYFRTNQLKWKNVEEGKIWIKVGADSGGESVKVYYQVVNVDSPNSPSNTTVFCIFEAGESPSNLHIALDGFVDEINNLQKLKWR